MGLFYPLVAVFLWAGGAEACAHGIFRFDFLGSSLGNVHPADRAGVISRLNDCVQYAVRRNSKISSARFVSHTDRCGNFYPKLEVFGNKKNPGGDPRTIARQFVASLGILVRGVRWRADEVHIPDPACTRRPVKPRLRPFPARLCNDGGASARRAAARRAARRKAAAAVAARRRAQIRAARRVAAARKLAAARKRAAIRARLYRQCGCGR